MKSRSKTDLPASLYPEHMDYNNPEFDVCRSRDHTFLLRTRRAHSNRTPLGVKAIGETYIRNNKVYLESVYLNKSLLYSSHVHKIHFILYFIKKMLTMYIYICLV